MSKTMVSAYIDADVKEMAMSKGINLSHALQTALEAELLIADIPDDEEDKMIEKLKLKVRKLLEIQRENVLKIAKLGAKHDKKDPKKGHSGSNYIDNDIRNHPDRARYAPKAELEGRI